MPVVDRAGLQKALSLSRPRSFQRIITTGLPAIDQLPPGGGLACGAVHEILSDTAWGRPCLFPLLLARSAAAQGVVVWSDPQQMLYPPAVARFGIDLERMFLLRPKDAADEVWAVNEALRCRGVAACVAALPRLSRIQARRLQLAAERGGIGLLLRPLNAIDTPYAAATRWVVRPAAGQRAVQRWSVTLIHGHGGRVGQNVILEVCRETNHVRASEAVADRPAAPAAAGALA